MERERGNMEPIPSEKAPRDVDTEAAFLINELKSRVMPKAWLNGDTAKPSAMFTFEEDTLLHQHVDYTRNHLTISRDKANRRESIYIHKRQGNESYSEIIFIEQSLPNGQKRTERNNHQASAKAIELIQGVPVTLNTSSVYAAK